MIVGSGSVLRLLAWQWRSVLLFSAIAAAVTTLHELEIKQFSLPALPLGVVGGALGIFVSFRTNSAYARWWEGRQLWGRLINSSRRFALQVLSYPRAAPDIDLLATQRELVERQVAYAHALRCALRKQNIFEDKEVQRLLPASEREALSKERNVCYALLHKQMARLAELTRAGALEELKLQSIDRTLSDIIDVQGGCERIKNTPMPKGYGFIGERLILAYSFLLPLAMVKELSWWTIPITVLVALSFTLISEAGRVLEDPFTMFWNSLPLTAISTTIEVNLRQRLGDADLPADVQPFPPGVLM